MIGDWGKKRKKKQKFIQSKHQRAVRKIGYWAWSWMTKHSLQDLWFN